MQMDKTYQPEKFEQQIYQNWEKSGYFSPNENAKKSFTIALPPPNVTGSLHMGHAFQQTIMDCLIRFHRMDGDNTLWQCGTDHAGIATQMVVERKLQNEENLTKHDLGRNEFIKRIWQWKEQSGGAIYSQMRRLGDSAPWDRARFTMDEGLSKAVLEVFVRLYDEGLIYRGKRLVNWDPKLRTAISDLEVENKEVKGYLWYIKYKLADNQKTLDGKDYLLVATTRPETLFGDTAVAVNPEDQRYKHLIGKNLIVPLVNRAIPIVADEHANMETGTGCVKITPAHDFNDYAVGKRHNLEMINILSYDATLLENAQIYDTNGNLIKEDGNIIPEYLKNVERFKAREITLEKLKEAQLLEKTEDHTLNQPFGDRGGVPIEPMLTDQWYVKAQVLGKEALEAVEDGRIKFVPQQYTNMYYSWMRDLQDWCISRQLWWGHRIPAWYDENSNVYVARDIQEVYKKYNLDENTKLTQDSDVLDTWFSSALWTFSTLGWPDDDRLLKMYHPTSVLVTGFDIIFFWVARMIMMTMHFIKNEDGSSQVPFHTVYVTGLIRDEEGQKMSKSKGNVLDPLDMIDGISLEDLLAKRTANMMQPQIAQKIAKRTQKQFPNGIAAHGTDALRFTLCALASNGRDINWDMKRLEGYRNFCNKIWNASRFVLMNIQDYDLKAPAGDDLTIADKYILSQLHKTIVQARDCINNYRFDHLANCLYEFIWNEYCDWYLEFTKAILKSEQISKAQKDATAYTLVNVLETILRLAHPVMPYITEQVWQQCAHLIGRQNAQKTIMLCAYPKENDYPCDQSIIDDISFIKDFISAIRNLKAEMKVPSNKAIGIMVKDADDKQIDLLNSLMYIIGPTALIDNMHIIKAQEQLPPAASKMVGNVQILVAMKDLINKDDELKKLNALVEKYQNVIASTKKRLEDPSFTSKAPEKIINGAKEQLKLNEIQLQKVLEQIEQLNNL